ncbi:glycosyltransferase family 4 protein [Knoellia sp. CPCC 206450]|uniref:glycosyltransferase family 4 protein n=1 Tax=Knoellia tibetensis TaxID=3404798 RepID=UPI003B429E92
MSEPPTRWRVLVGNVRAVSAVAVHGLEDDPVRLALLAARRLPASWRAPLSRVLEGTGRSLRRRSPQVLALLLADHPDEAREALGPLAGRSGGRLSAELAVQLDADLPDDLPPSGRARAAWQRGDVSGALAALEGAGSGPSRRQRARLASEVDVLTPGRRLPVPPRPPTSTAATMAPTVSRAGRRDGGHRVLHLLTNSLPRTRSGYAYRSQAILRAQQAEGMTVEAVTRLGYPVTVGVPWAGDVDVVEGVTYRRLLPSRMATTAEDRLTQTAGLLVGHVDRLGADVLHTTTHFPNALVARAVAEATGRPWVYEARGQLEKTWLASRPPEQRAAAAASERYALWRERETEAAVEADHVVVLSEVLKADFTARGVPAERITVVPNAVDDELLDPALECFPADARDRLGLPREGFWVGTVSSVVGYEGLDDLLRAVAQLRSSGLDVRCAIAGDGTARPALEQLAARLGVSDAVVLPGRVAKELTPVWHRALDVFVVPRRDTDVTRSVTPLKPIEAMAAGRPVVASDLPALAEIVGAPGTGLLSTPEDPSSLAGRLRELYDDEALRHALGARGREFAATRTWRAMAGRYDSIYRALGRTT